MDEAATRDDLQGVGRALESLTETVRQSTESNTRVMQGISEALNARPSPAPPTASGGRVEMHFKGSGVGVWVAATAALLALAVTYMQGQRVTDSLIAQQGLRQEVATAIASERASRERFETWAAEESNTLRTFARTGVLAPMKTRPDNAQDPPK